MRVIGRTFALAVILALFSIPAVMIPAVLATPPAVEDQPHMQEALDALKQARHHLEAAIPDKDGHRSAAIKACDEAIHQTEAGIKYAQDHPY